MVDEREVAEVLEPGFAADLADHPTDELRRRRRACEAVEADLSFRRRVLHGHMDLLRAELARRSAGVAAGVDVADLVERLADGPTPSHRSPSHQRLAVDVGGEVEAFSADLLDASDDELRGRGEDLVEREHELSRMRRVVLDRLDAIQAEVLRRYRDGSASIDEILPPADR